MGDSSRQDKVVCEREIATQQSVSDRRWWEDKTSSSVHGPLFPTVTTSSDVSAQVTHSTLRVKNLTKIMLIKSWTGHTKRTVRGKVSLGNTTWGLTKIPVWSPTSCNWVHRFLSADLWVDVTRPRPFCDSIEWYTLIIRPHAVPRLGLKYYQHTVNQNTQIPLDSFKS